MFFEEIFVHDDRGFPGANFPQVTTSVKFHRQK